MALHYREWEHKDLLGSGASQLDVCLGGGDSLHLPYLPRAVQIQRLLSGHSILVHAPSSFHILLYIAATALPWKTTDHLLVCSPLRIPLKTVPDKAACVEPAKVWLPGRQLFVSSSSVPLGCSHMLPAVSMRSCYCTFTHWLLHLAVPKMRSQLCKPEIAYCIFAQHLAQGMRARASAGDWKANNSWQSWLKCVPWKYFSAENGPFSLNWFFLWNSISFVGILHFFSLFNKKL